MRIRTPLFYEARLAFGFASLLPALFLPGYALLGWIIWTLQEQRPDVLLIASVFERGLALSAGLLAAHLMSIEREERFDEMRRSYPERSWRVPLLRSLGAVGLTLGAVVLAAFIFRLAYGDYSLSDMILPALSPALYLLGLALLVNNVSSSNWVAVTAVVGYWFLEYFTGGQYTGVLFLFRATMPNPEIDYRWLLVGLGFVWLGTNLLYSMWRREHAG
jgi:ABC-type transport system involved in multi-copper enzyme maturation permease subunit